MDVVARLERELEEAQELLQEKDTNLIRAAELGKGLLESNHELNARMEEMAKDFTQRIEALEQEKYSLQRKLECEQLLSSSAQQEVDTTRRRLEEEHALREQKLEQVHSKKLHHFSCLSNDLQAEAEKLEVQLKVYQDRVSKQEITIEELREEVKRMANSTIMQTELMDLEKAYADERSSCEHLKSRIMEAEGTVELLTVENSSLAHKVESMEEVCEERSRQANTWYEALQTSKMEIFELNTQLEHIKMEALGSGFQRAGNSLFGEVEDRRMQVERKMISLQVKYDSLVKTNTTTKQQLKKMKAEMSALLCQYGSSAADADHVRRLKQALDQSRRENQTLLSKLHKLEKQQAGGVVSSMEKQKCIAAFSDFGDKKEYIRLLEQELESAKAKWSQVVQELEMKRTQLLWEENKLSSAETRLHQSEQERAQIRKDLTKLSMRLQESREKFDDVMTTCKQLEADKKFLEEQLKTRGRARDPKNPPRQSGRHLPDNSLTLHSTHSAENISCSKHSEGVSEKEEEEEEEKERGAGCSSSHSSPKKQINFLEDLEKEVQKQKTDTALGSRRSSDNLKLLTSKPSSGAAKAPARVVSVRNKENVNQCPQQ